MTFNVFQMHQLKLNFFPYFHLPDDSALCSNWAWTFQSQKNVAQRINCTLKASTSMNTFSNSIITKSISGNRFASIRILQCHSRLHVPSCTDDNLIMIQSTNEMANFKLKHSTQWSSLAVLIKCQYTSNYILSLSHQILWRSRCLLKENEHSLNKAFFSCSMNTSNICIVHQSLWFCASNHRIEIY